MAYTERYVRADAAGGGDGTTDANSGGTGAYTLAEAIAAAAAGVRFNVKAGVYANTTTNRVFNVAGSTTQPIWWRGFKTTAGDMDGTPSAKRVAGTDIPQITFSTGNFQITASFQMFSNMSIEGAQTTRNVFINGPSNIWMRRVRAINTGTNANSLALLTSSGNDYFFKECFFDANSAASQAVSCTGRSSLAGCVVSGGTDGLDLSALGSVYRCVFDNNGDDAISVSASNAMFIVGNTIYSPGGHGIRIVSGYSNHGFIADNLFYDVNQASKAAIFYAGASAVQTIFRARNSFYNCTAEETGFGDSPNFNHVTESSAPLDDPANDDFDLKTAALSYQAAMPQLFEGVDYKGYASIGALMPNVAGGGGARGSLLRGLVG